MMERFEFGDEDSHDPMRELFTPAQVDQTVREAIQICWLMLPKEKRTIDEVERQLRRIVDRAINDLREDGEAFGKTHDK